MDADTFFNSLAQGQPPEGSSDLLRSLWWDRKGDWDRAHRIAQEIATMEGSAIHAYLHREEGVLWNADYWYRAAGRERPAVALEVEWEGLVEEMLRL